MGRDVRALYMVVKPPNLKLKWRCCPSGHIWVKTPYRRSRQQSQHVHMDLTTSFWTGDWEMCHYVTTFICFGFVFYPLAFYKRQQPDTTLISCRDLCYSVTADYSHTASMYVLYRQFQVSINLACSCQSRFLSRYFPARGKSIWSMNRSGAQV